VYAFASAELPPAQRTALAAWLEGASFDDIAGRAQPRDAAKLVRAALGHLRRRFRDDRR
jgi:hypothetical protein